MYLVFASVSIFDKAPALVNALLIPPSPPGKSNGAFAESLSDSSYGAPALNTEASNKFPITLSTLAVLKIPDMSLLGLLTLVALANSAAPPRTELSTPSKIFASTFVLSSGVRDLASSVKSVFLEAAFSKSAASFLSTLPFFADFKSLNVAFLLKAAFTAPSSTLPLKS